MSENTSGVNPLGDAVLVKPDNDLPTKHGILEIPQSIVDRHSMAQTYGILIAWGPTAFKFEEKEYGVTYQPKVGQRMMFSKYGGIIVKGEDGKQYRMFKDGDLLAEVSENIKLELS
jgi:chaperonin GroES